MTGTPPLWRRLQPLQPTLPLFAGSNHSARKTTTEHAAAAPRRMSYSFVVVPPPVPAATPAFEAHVSTLLRHVPHPTFITCTSYSPYFTSAAAESLAAAADTADESANAMEASVTQQALSYLHQCVAADVGLVLTVTATRATSHAESVQSTQGGDQDSQQHPKQHTSSSSASMVPTTTTLTGASRGGTAAILADFIGRTSAAPATKLGTANSQEATRHRSRGLMVLRGDDGGYTRQCMIAAQKGGASASPPSLSPNPYVDFADGVDLLRFIHSTLRGRDGEAMCEITGDEPAGAAVCLCIGGYPQGHVLDRQWGADAATAAAVPSAQSPLPCQTLASLRFLDEVDTVFADTEAQLRRAQGTHSAPRPPSLESCVEAAEALFARLGAVRRLWTTPSYYPPSVRAACTRRTVANKVFLRPPGTRQCVADSAWDGCGSAGAHVVVTQVITSATEFFDYVEDIRNALRSSVPPARGVPCDRGRDGAAATEARGASVPCLQLRAASALPSSSPSLVIVPGLMAPLRAEQFLRSALQLKVIPSVPFQRALREYEGALHSAVETLRSAVSSNAIDVYAEAKERAEACFQEWMVAITVDIVRDLRARGYTHVNFSAFQYGCGDAVGCVVAALAAEGREEVVEEP
ncbi:conserved hypothetical protein [Leishmania major strain Friedlin]|uniref:Uncharacterized protein n=1 Tax=Leishmania major TaxID=5664 RepID=Q4QHD8_LEIMA|nr:conserved hypothetical protein [Leishmania major strain Friedlin]CAG9570057.1 hypothetical_protein_-_conserved [Leishmania major strain Friedlin]CAJ02781.1 conserved hypothetical protein [Leishmania major strain Friedlin]|eukprot:XP_001681410.1 conserved hypothetical protein [Leishmania major strain Friedlin]